MRGVHAKEREEGGKSVGLPISRVIIEAHGGEMGADSAPGKGSTFHFTLPLASPSKSRVDQPGDVLDVQS